MDILKKMFTKNDEDDKRKEDNASSKDEFRKPQWFEEAETDDELFDDDRKFVFQVFTNPLELQKHIESQMQQFLEAFNDTENNGARTEKNVKEEMFKPGFESKILKEFKKQNQQNFDTDLDGETHTERLNSLIQRFANGESIKELPQINQQTPSNGGNILPRNDNKTMRNKAPRLTDEEIIMGRIHGTLDEENQEVRKPIPAVPRYRPDVIHPMSPIMPRGDPAFPGSAFNGTFQGPKMFSQSILTKTVRKPDGSYETTKVIKDSQGNKTTTVTRNINGKTETITTYDGAAGTAKEMMKKEETETETEPQIRGDRNIYVSKDGYALPRNLW